MKGKPIEPGCLAMIVGAVNHPQNNGKVVRVVRLVTERGYTPPEIVRLIRNVRYSTENHRSWVVETTDGSRSLQVQINRNYSSGQTVLMTFDVSSRAVAEIRLKRLDDGEDYKEREVTTQLEGVL